MRNLKKILALVLALVMSMSLLATANAFSDDANIDETYATAVEVLSGLKVFQGRPDGNFDPKAGITRAEVAAILYRIVSKDIADKQVGLYADYNKFVDVNSASWYAGYVNFCANGELINGYGNGQFGPNDAVTGYQALAMVLRAVGYGKNGEFTGTGWEVRTASIAKQLGITNNITAGALGTAATREVVAEILFQAIMVPTVSYTLALGYDENDTTLGYDNFGLEYIEGIVTGNEYADLYDSSALAEGKTRLTTEDKDYNLAVATALTDLGENRVAYIAGKGGVKTVLTLVDEGNTVFETGDATDISTAKKFAKTTGMADDAEHFFNFDQNITGKYESDYRIAFGDPDKGLTVRKAGEKFSEDDIKEIKSIFGDDDDDVADQRVVYVGTQNKDDISDTMSFKKFVKEYLYGADTQATVEGTVNGDWLKVIDNDGDGEAEYVFKTTFDMEQVIGLSKKGVLTLTADGGSIKFDADEYVTSAELEVGNIVLYTVIDGVVFVELAPAFNGPVEKYTYKTGLLTVGGEEYAESGIDEHTGFMSHIEDTEKKVDYTYFQDFFGHIRIFALPTSANGELVLLTDGYYENNRTGKIYAVMAYLDGEINDYDVANNKGGFIDTADKHSNNDWEKLVEFGDYTGYDENALTNLARYTMDEENVLSLSTAKTYTYGKTGAENGIKTDYIDLDDVDFAAGETDFAGVYTNDEEFAYDAGNVTVQANKDTVYYYVSYASGEPVVKTVTGYKNSLSVVDEIVDIRAMYAVASNVHSDSKNTNYWVADAIVIETEYPVYESANDVVLGYNVLNKTVRDFGDMESIIGDATTDELNVTMVNGAHKGEKIDYDEFTQDHIETPYFYTNTETEDGDSFIHSIEKNFGKYGIYVATVDREVDLYDYIVADNEKGTKLYYDEETVVYDMYQYNSKAVDVTTEDDDEDALVLETGETYIVYAPDNDIVYAVRVDFDYNDDDDYVLDDAILGDLYNLILADAHPVEAAKNTLYSVKVLGKDAVKVGDFEYVATVCANEATTEGNRLEVVDNYAGAKMELYGAELIASGTGKVVDAGKEITENTTWTVKSNGAEYTIHVIVRDHNSTVTSKDAAKVSVDGTVITVDPVYGDESTLTGAKLAEMLNGLTADYSYDADAHTFTVVAACGHSVIYTVIFADIQIDPEDNYEVADRFSWGDALETSSVPAYVQQYIRYDRGEYYGPYFKQQPSVIPVAEGVNTSFFDSQRNLWIGTDEGIYIVMNDGSVRTVTGTELLAYENVVMMYDDGDTGAWVLCGNPADDSANEVCHIFNVA